MVYYNENDPKIADWLQALVNAKLIADGAVDTRSIEDVEPDDLTEFTQCHFFAGIGGWSYALRLAGWPDDRPVWTGSCPCQPFSAAGKGEGFADERHLWPAWHWLIEQCRPPVIFGEQVATALGWYDLVSGDLEGQGYACGAAVLGAHSIGAPHIRQRLWFVADAHDERPQGRGRGELQERAGECVARAISASGDMADRTGDGRREKRTNRRRFVEGNRQEGLTPGSKSSGEPVNGFWRDAEWIYCRDDKFRPVEPGTFPLAHGVSARVGRLRGYGNAVVPHVAAEFVKSYLDVEDE